MEQNSNINQGTSTKKIYFLYALIFLIAIFIFVLFFKKIYLIETYKNFFGIEEKQEIPKIANKIYPNFYFAEQSNNYKTLTEALSELEVNVTNGRRNEGQGIQDIYRLSLDIYNDVNLPPKERAYAINILNSAYLQGFESQLFIDIIKDYPNISEVYNSYLEETSKYKKLNSKGYSSTLYEVGTPEINYATQKTMAYLNGKAYDLYPNSYSFLRQNINTVQADALLFANYDLGKKYRNQSEFVIDKYDQKYIDSVEEKINKFKNEGKLYEGLFFNAYEIDIMISNGYLYTLKYLPLKYINTTEAIEEKKNILMQMNSYSDNTLNLVKNYNVWNNIFLGQSISALTKVQVVIEEVLSKEENDRILAEAISIMKELIKNQRNQQFNVWIQKLPRNGNLNYKLEYLMSKDEEIKKYVEDVRK